MMPRIIAIVALLCGVSTMLFAEEVQSLTAQRRDTLRFGIDSEVVDLVNIIASEKDKELAAELVEILQSARSSAVVNAILSCLATLKIETGADIAATMVKNFAERGKETVTLALRYLETIRSKAALVLCRDLLLEKDESLQIAAIGHMAALGGQEEAAELLVLYKKNESSKNVLGEIILAFGKLKAAETIELMEKLAVDPQEDPSLRRYACDSLGRIRAQSSFAVLRGLLADGDANLRATVVYAIGFYESDDAVTLLIEATRDSFWKVRLSAVEQLGKRKAERAVPALIYKAEKDPEKKIRQAAMDALGEIGGDAAGKTIRKMFETETAPGDVRLAALQNLLDHFSTQAIEAASALLDREWAKPSPPMLDAVCKVLSLHESGSLSGLYERMLGHQSLNIKLYGLRGIRLNKLTALKDKVQPLTAENIHPLVRKTAISVLESLQ